MALIEVYLHCGSSSTVSAMASRWRRVLIWLGFVEPEGSAGLAIWRSTYVCPTCGAVITATKREQHAAWHQRVGG
jgi:hypothetical protein